MWGFGWGSFADRVGATQTHQTNSGAKAAAEATAAEGDNAGAEEVKAAAEATAAAEAKAT
eukprot:CAMPEP_0172592808 /NCGR_PEP_ID=MMETSP1068-20121228/11902_1 /TAXON_ID=35684 /ORGANISM="Pseudopedinella elastica, Strain CCMP716" /LENGTH=59 /DNA_ID=CAMNT_0013390015 /DNA_START=1 /DNA_END=180 /DNA_ORIENTATION=-